MTNHPNRNRTLADLESDIDADARQRGESWDAKAFLAKSDAERQRLIAAGVYTPDGEPVQQDEGDEDED